MILHLFTIFHVLISLIGIATGLLVIYGFLTTRAFPSTTNTFLVTTIATSITGFFFPIHGLTPGLILGVVSLVVLAIALWARKSGWHKTWIATVTLAEFFNILVLIAQSFGKIPPLHAIAPTGKEPIIAISQGVTFLIFAILGILAMRKPTARDV